jgi:hypothetical protein
VRVRGLWIAGRVTHLVWRKRRYRLVRSSRVTSACAAPSTTRSARCARKRAVTRWRAGSCSARTLIRVVIFGRRRRGQPICPIACVPAKRAASEMLPQFRFDVPTPTLEAERRPREAGPSCQSGRRDSNPRPPAPKAACTIRQVTPPSLGVAQRPGPPVAKWRLGVSCRVPQRRPAHVLRGSALGDTLGAPADRFPP